MRTATLTVMALLMVLFSAALLAQTPPPPQQPDSGTASNAPPPPGPPLPLTDPSQIPAKSAAPTAAAHATPAPPPGHWDAAIKRLDEQLTLSEHQKTKIKGIFQDEMKQSQAIYRDTTLPPQKKRDSLQAISKKSHDDIRKLLTPDQQKKYDEMQTKPAPGTPAKAQAK